MTTSVSIMNIYTKEIKVFFSIKSCACFLQCNPKTLTLKLKNGKNKRPFRGYFFKYTSDETRWPSSIVPRVRIHNRAVTLTHVITGVIENYASITLASKKLGCHRQSIVYQAERKIPVPYKGYFIRFKCCVDFD